MARGRDRSVRGHAGDTCISAPTTCSACRFAVSPLCETHEAVRTLRRADRHGYHLPWLRRMRVTLAAIST